jgi:hypothetical protein
MKKNLFVLLVLFLAGAALFAAAKKESAGAAILIRAGTEGGVSALGCGAA